MTALARVPYPAIKAEGAKIGLVWKAMTGLLVHTFDVGTVRVVVQPGDHPEAERLVDHLVEAGMAEDACTTDTSRREMCPRPQDYATQ